MSVESVASNQRSTPDWVADDEIDLRKYIGILIRWWREIVLLTLLAAVAGGLAVYALRLISTPVYEASSSVAIVRTFSDVSFDPRFRTLSEDTAEGATSLGAARRGALLGLVRSGAIAQIVIDELGDQLSPAEQTAARLLDQVEANLVTPASGRAGESDLIRIAATADSPQKATTIVNAWTRAYVDQVNAIYGQVSDEQVASIQNELMQAQTGYEQAQLALEGFIATSNAGNLARMVEDKASVVASLMRAKDAALTAAIDDMIARRKRVAAAYLDAQADNELLAFNREQQAQRALLDSYLDALSTTQVATFRNQVDDSLQRLSGYYDRRTRLTNVLANARTLQEQVAASESGEVSASVLTYQLMLLDTLTSGPDQQIVLLNSSAAAMSPGLASTTYAAPSAVGEASPAGATGAVPQAPLPAVTSQLPQAAPSQQAPSVQVQVANSPVQLQLTPPASVSKEQLQDSLAAFVGALESRIAQLDAGITALSDALLSGDNYEYLNARIPEGSQLTEAIREQYPALFGTSQLAQQGMEQASESTLSSVGLGVTDGLLKLNELPDMAATNNDDALNQSVSQLHEEIRRLRSELEAEQARERQLVQARDLSWETLSALKNKVAELTLARAASSSEVRLAAAAVEPADPVPGFSLLMSVALAGMMGLLLSIFIAFVADFMGRRPFLSRSTL